MSDRGILYISRLPRGLEEKPLRKYLEQFGAVTNLRLGRSRKTGASRGFAFAEFRFRAVAEVVRDTMNNYLMFEKIVKCELIDDENVKSRKAVFAGRVDPHRPPPAVVARRAAKAKVNALRTEEQNNKRLKRQLARLESMKRRLQEAGINAEMAEFASMSKTPVMAVDDSDLDITLKTPPNVRKVKSAGNSLNTTPKNLSALKKRNNANLAKEVAAKIVNDKVQAKKKLKKRKSMAI